MDDLQFFVGSWDLQATNPSTDTTIALRYDVEVSLGGIWLAGRVESADPPLQIRDFWGHDAVTREIVRIIVDSQGNYGVVRSSGWRDDTLELVGDVNSAGGVVPVRETITRVADHSFRAVWEANGKDGWYAYSVEVLTRRPANP